MAGIDRHVVPRHELGDRIPGPETQEEGSGDY